MICVKIKGMTFGWCSRRGEYRKPYAEDSLFKLKQTGSEWIALSFYTYQDTFYSTNIYFDYGYTVTDKDIEYAVNMAHAMGFKVCLKPVVNCRDGVWRAKIGFPEGEGAENCMYWEKWFKSYNNFMNHYAELAQDTGCEMLCIGCEMLGTEKKIGNWRELIKRLRKVYTGPLVYNTNHGHESEVEWFNDLDFIGTSAYFPVGEKPSDCEKNMITNWEKVKKHLYIVHKKFNKPIIFMEIGCRSGRGFAMIPWECGHDEFPFDEDEQANFYSSALKVFWSEPWFGGFFWWDWNTRLYSIDDAKTNKSFCIYGKTAENVLKQWYTK